MKAQISRPEDTFVDAYKEDVERNIAAAYYSDALEALLDMTRDMRPELKRGALSLYARYSRWRRAVRDNLTVEDNIDRITAAILEFTEEVATVASIPKAYAIETRPQAASLDDHSRDADVVKLPVEKSTALGPHTNAERSAQPEALRDTSPHSGLNALRTAYWKMWRSQQKSEKDVVIIVAESISRRFSGRRFCLKDISLELRRGEITGIVGVNASGKTTLLRLLLGDLKPDTGRLRYPAITDKPRDWRDIKAKLGYIPQLPPRWPGRLRDNLAVTAAATGLRGSKNRHRVDYFVQRYGLDEYETFDWNEISGGFRIRFEIVRALLSDPLVLLLDEPLAYLDIITQQILLYDLKTIASSFENPIPIVVTSQHLYEIEAIADNLLIIDDGICIFSGALDQMPHAHDRFIFEFSIKREQKDLLRELRPIGLIDLERTMTGYIGSFDRKHGKQNILQVMVGSFGENLIYIRDITRSTRSLFRNKRDSFLTKDDMPL